MKYEEFKRILVEFRLHTALGGITDDEAASALFDKYIKEQTPEVNPNDYR